MLLRGLGERIRVSVSRAGGVMEVWKEESREGGTEGEEGRGRERKGAGAGLGLGLTVNS